MKNIIVYDVETTGRSYHFDQILQISAVLLDENLNQLDEIDFRSRLLKGIIPHISALQTNGLSYNQLTQSNMSSYEMIKEVEETFKKWSPAIFVGHNSTAFDDNFLRLSLYKNLRKPYITNTNGSQRGDSLLLARATSVFSPNAINVPRNSRGTKVFSLGLLADANNIHLTNAHDALADVKATASLLSLIKKQAPEMWRSFLLTTSKKGASEFMQSHSYFCFAPTPSQASVLKYCCDNNDTSKNETYHFNLKYDPMKVVDLDVIDLEKVILKGSHIKKIKINSTPILMDESYASCILDEKVDSQTLEKRANIIANNHDFIKRLSKAVSNLNTSYPNGKYVEQQIFDGGFPSSHDEANMAYFHVAPSEEKLQCCLDFEDPKFTKLGLHILYQENADLLPKDQFQKIDQEIKNRIESVEDEPFLTLHDAIQSFEKTKEEDPTIGKDLIRDYEKLLENYVY